MQVETYTTNVGDNEASRLCQSAEYVERIESSNLEGQKKLIDPNNVEVFNFKAATREQHLICKTLFPQVHLVETFALELIPGEVLDVVKKAQESKAFDRIEVWSTPYAIVSDPVLMGVKKQKGKYGFDEEHFFILARWGEKLQTFAELRSAAVKIWLEKAQANLNDKIDEIAAFKSKLARVAAMSVDGDISEVLASSQYI